MITGFPPHIPPVVEDVRCHCGRYYHVYVGTCDVEAELAEREAEQKDAVFVDSRKTPWLYCRCRQFLDFMPEGSMIVQ